MGYAYDNDWEPNPIHVNERTEERRAAIASTEVERIAGCQHTARHGHRTCPDCGDGLDP